MKINTSNLGSIYDLATNTHYDSETLRKLIKNKVKELRQEGIDAESTVILKATSTPDFFIALLALFEISSTVVPISEKLTSHEIKNLQHHCLAGHIIEHNEVFKYKQYDKSKGFALILYTSGTTGSPKGVAISYEKLQRKIQVLKTVFLEDEIKRTLCLLPVSFGHGLIANSLFPLLHGGKLFLAPAFDLKILLNLEHICDKHQITFMSSVPSLWKTIFHLHSKLQLKSLRRVICASSVLSNSLKEQIIGSCPNSIVSNAYGLTEALSWILVTRSSQEEGLGTPIEGEIRFQNPQTKEFSDKEGEILVYSQYLFDEYLNSSSLTKSSFEGKYFKTGDIGKRNKDGHIIYQGRIKNIVSRAGFKIYPEEVENLVLSSNMTKDCFCFGASDPIWEEELIACIVLKNNSDESKKKFLSWAGQHLPTQIRPSKWFYLEKIPKNRNGKNDKNKTIEKISLLNQTK